MNTWRKIFKAEKIPFNTTHLSFKFMDGGLRAVILSGEVIKVSKDSMLEMRKLIVEGYFIDSRFRDQIRTIEFNDCTPVGQRTNRREVKFGMMQGFR
jgi:hypothetical protein